MATGRKFRRVRKIVVLKASVLGDFVASIPALWALKEAYPKAEITLLGQSLHVQLLANRPSPVDRVIDISRFRVALTGENLHPHGIDGFFREMQGEGFDFAIQMYGGGRHSNPFTKQLGARITVGFKTPEASPLDIWTPYIFYQNEVFRNLELVGLIGAKTENILPRVEVTLKDREEVRNKLGSLGKYIVIHPGASDTRRRWPAARFAQVADTFASEGYQIVVTGTEMEQDNIDLMVRSMSTVPVVANNLTLSGLVGLLDGATLTIANDSGPMHLSDAVGTPTIAIFWAGNLVTWVHLNRRTFRFVPSWTVNCPLCGAHMVTDSPVENGCDHNANFVEGVTVEQVVITAQQLLADRA